MILKIAKQSLKSLRNNKALYWAVLGLILGIAFHLLQHKVLARWLVSVFSVIAIIPILKGMWHSIRNGRYGIDLPGVIVVVAAIVLHQYWAGIIVAIILIVNEKLKNIIIAQVHKKQSKLLEQIPDLAHVFRKHKLVDIQVGDVRVGEEIEIRPGEVVPLDSVLSKGDGDFQELTLTGENELLHREVGESILCGVTIVNGTVSAKVVRAAPESQFRQLIRNERTAVNSAGPFALQADRYSIMFMMGAYIIAAAAWFLSGQPLRFLEVIIVVTPATFILAPMIAFTNGLNLASKNGIIIRTNSIFERLSAAKTFGFEKSTLARKAAEVDKVFTFKPYTQHEAEIYAGSILQRSAHTLAQAVKKLVISNNLKLLKTKHVKELPGFGAEARIGNKEVVVGNYGVIKERGIEIPPHFKIESLSQTAVFIGINGSLIGYITFTDSFRTDIKPMLKSLSRLGARKSFLVTDEGQSIGLKVTKLLGITDVKSNVQSGDQLQELENVSDRPLAFIGNGLDDATLLTAADVGIAINVRGSTAAGEAADIIIMQDDLGQVAFAMAIAKQAFALARQAILVAVGLSLILMLILATGKVQPLAGAFIRVAIEVLVLGFVSLRREPSVPR